MRGQGNRNKTEYQYLEATYNNVMDCLNAGITNLLATSLTTGEEVAVDEDYMASISFMPDRPLLGRDWKPLYLCIAIPQVKVIAVEDFDWDDIVDFLVGDFERSQHPDSYRGPDGVLGNDFDGHTAKGW